jgi:hypothetical protein
VISRLNQSLQLKLGDPNVLVCGKHAYRLKYVIKNPARNSGSTLSYEWSPNGKNWQMPIKAMTVSLSGASPAVSKSLVAAKDDRLSGATIAGAGGNYKVRAHDLQPGQAVSIKISLSAASAQIPAGSITANRKTGILQGLT